MLGRRALNLLASTPLPAHWFYPAPPAEHLRAQRTGKLSIEIVSHCWGYSRLLAYQLTSLIDNPIKDARVRMTVYYGEEDTSTVQLLDFVAQHDVDNVTWNWQAMPKEQLFRRAIGRNIAAKATDADWIWFTDCDMTFQHNCLDSLNTALQGRQDALVYPRIESKTDAYTEGDDSPNALEAPELLRADTEAFVPHSITRATGPLQITHGDVARAVGYCADVPFYQQPQERWQKTYEDRMFRWLLGTPGVAIDVDGVCRVQHVDKGRYAGSGDANTLSSSVRKRIRTWQDGMRKRTRS